MSNILVTGGAGSMGRLVSELLINNGHFVPKKHIINEKNYRQTKKKKK